MFVWVDLDVELGDILELKSKKDIVGENPNLALAYESDNYGNLMLINATAQLALSPPRYTQVVICIKL